MFRKSIAFLSVAFCVGVAPAAFAQRSEILEKMAAPHSVPYPTENSTLKPAPQTSTVRVVVKLKQRRVFVFDGEKEVAHYAIAIGKKGWETPIGNHEVINKVENPIFQNFKTGNIIQPGPDNPLGVRWIGFLTDGKTQFGFHGTNQPELIGQAVSHGCVRMRNKDVVKLYEQVSLRTPVIVQP